MTTKYLLEPNLVHCYRRTNGDPLISGGWLYTFKDTDHNTSKAIYECSDGTCPYPNPTPIGASGTLPLMYWADDEQYYVELYDGKKDAGGELIYSFDHFPDIAISPDSLLPDERNYFDNPEFRKFTTSSYSSTDLLANVDAYIADEGWVYHRNNVNATNTITFKEFVAGQIVVPDNPKYYLEFECSNIGIGGENRSDIIQKINDVTLFSGENVSFAVWGESPTTSVVELIFYQYFGVGGDVPVVTTSLITFSSTYEQYIIDDFSIPSVTGKNIQHGNYLGIGLRMPLNDVSIVRFTKFQLNRSATLLHYDLFSINQEDMKKRSFELPDLTANDHLLPIYWDYLTHSYKVDALVVGEYVFDPRKSRTGLLPADGTTYCTLDKTPDGIVTYKRLWQAWEDGEDTSGNMGGYGTDGFIIGERVNNVTTIINNKEYTSITDWVDNNTGFIFTKFRTGSDFEMSAVLPGLDNLTETNINRYTASDELLVINKSNGNVTDASAQTSPFTFTVIQQGDGTHPEKTLIKFTDSSLVTASDYFFISSPLADIYVWVKKNGVGTDPAIGGRTGIQVNLVDGMGAYQVAYVIRLALIGCQARTIQTVAASTLSGGEYFLFYNYADDFVGYITIDGSGDDPDISGKRSVELALITSDNADQVAVKLETMLRSVYFNVPDFRGMGLRITDYGRGLDPDSALRYVRGDKFAADISGTWQRDDLRAHNHTYTQVTNPSAAAVSSPPDANRYFTIQASTDDTGGHETRMINRNVNIFVRY